MARHLYKYEDRLDQDEEPLKEFKLSKSKIMYIENKSEGLEGEARIGIVYLSESGKTY